ncbi:hypothetical protein M0804_009419 [Polistes exclamans]|nr:hypothetical protein M0804_009419 [Polistes exclamans]
MRDCGLGMKSGAHKEQKRQDALKTNCVNAGTRIAPPSPGVRAFAGENREVVVLVEGGGSILAKEETLTGPKDPLE